MNAIELSGLTKAFPRFQLGPVDLTLPRGAILGLVGENGAGKSTAIKLMLDLLRPDAGSISLLGQPVPAAYPRLKEEIGVVMDEVAYPAYLTPAEIGAFLSRLYRQWDGDAYRGYLDRFSLPEDQKFGEFSRGMKMKLGLAAALSHRAKLLLLDEATSGLDPMVRQEILDLLYDFCTEETAVLLSSHIVSDLEKICDYIAFLHRGRLVFLEEKDRLLEHYGLLKCEPDRLAELDPAAILAQRVHRYGAEALVDRRSLPAGLTADKCTLEEMIVLLAKEGNS